MVKKPLFKIIVCLALAASVLGAATWGRIVDWQWLNQFDGRTVGGNSPGDIVTTDADQDINGVKRFDDLRVGSAGADRVAPSGVFGSEHYPNLSSVPLDIDFRIASGGWISIGPTGSGATYIWTVLDAVPAGASWIEVGIVGHITTSTAGSQEVFVYTRPNGSMVFVNSKTQRYACMVNGTGSGSQENKIQAFPKVNLSSARIFDLYWTESPGLDLASIDMYLEAWGVNP